MANHIWDLLSLWEPKKDQLEWVLATIIETEGSSYRKPGAMMLINSLGQYRGLLSGGCLEADIMRQARKCWESLGNIIIEYDMREEDDLAWQLGLGCGGRVKILLQPVSAENNYLELIAMKQALDAGHCVHYHQDLSALSPRNTLTLDIPNQFSHSQQNSFSSIHKPPISLAVFGGGIDARPIVEMAVTLGWHVYLIDHRTGYAREKYFSGCKQIIRQQPEQLAGAEWISQMRAAVIMTHNINQDAQALKLVQSTNAEYVGLLGPKHRTEKVLDVLQMTRSDLVKPLWNPMGLSLGGELPESIALSAVSEIHKVIYGASGEPLSAG
ncbi:XdhC family protein [Paraneptunicella aestuarii]|uniref:XdhC family protein n=1 Tax=Paraneptunicella aestuarii TaxID=2831148 RepID=UPI001E6432DB|nr:XdhC family protein [Paraneptunicella aestuarii]UAA40536.1 XdhC family protein [Paraneptunicella aestuarii]